MLVEAGFWVLLGLVFYIYAGYPVGVLLLAPWFDRRVHKADITPSVTVLIAAFNEQAEIQRTIESILAQDYPAERLDVIVVSDCSTDDTDEILSALAARRGGRVLSLRQASRQGKSQALNLAARHSDSEILAFADANSFYESGALCALVRNFADPTVGYVTGRMVYTNAGGSGVGEGSLHYMRYENLLRSCETRLGSIVGVDGAIDAMRRDLFVPPRADQLSDFVLPLSVVKQGRRVVYEPDAILLEPALGRASDEFRMRVRVALRSLWTLYDKRALLDPVRYPLYSWQLVSHKLLRYVAFIPLIGLFVLSVAAARLHDSYFWFLLLQIACYALAALGHLLRETSGIPRLLFAPYYFCIVNLACIVALWKFLTGQKITVWKPRLGDEPGGAGTGKALLRQAAEGGERPVD